MAAPPVVPGTAAQQKPEDPYDNLGGKYREAFKKHNHFELCRCRVLFERAPSVNITVPKLPEYPLVDIFRFIIRSRATPRRASAEYLLNLAKLAADLPQAKPPLQTPDLLGDTLRLTGTQFLDGHSSDQHFDQACFKYAVNRTLQDADRNFAQKVTWNGLTDSIAHDDGLTSLGSTLGLSEEDIKRLYAPAISQYLSRLIADGVMTIDWHKKVYPSDPPPFDWRIFLYYTRQLLNSAGDAEQFATKSIPFKVQGKEWGSKETELRPLMSREEARQMAKGFVQFYKFPRGDDRSPAADVTKPTNSNRQYQFILENPGLNLTESATPAPAADLAKSTNPNRQYRFVHESPGVYLTESVTPASNPTRTLGSVQSPNETQVTDDSITSPDAIDVHESPETQAPTSTTTPRDNNTPVNDMSSGFDVGAVIDDSITSPEAIHGQQSLETQAPAGNTISTDNNIPADDMNTFFNFDDAAQE